MTQAPTDVVQFFQDAGFHVTPHGPDRWHIRFAHPQLPDLAIDEEVTLRQLREVYATIAQRYTHFLTQQDRGHGHLER